MEKETIMQALDEAFTYGKKLLNMWHEKKLEQIRLETANLRRIEEYKYHSIEEINRKKSERFNKSKGGNNARY